ncbi:PREDICTED: uncharacterized protein LOC104775860 [Camelina sativa]|uniref:Uncharacterized protein LOC104775860 n=1 Tax=Camelina sativa TaxID=90675 RepID=A0ABM0YAF5_CAMSA|nr:PREDICTED: uncharacterized protein LOC104775860 [Camelina sativa]XP_010498105.1 PREDICTED: uncharacterized protein LOC104775860 [Camelina sativa]
MKKEDDGYNYICELGCKSISWKLSEIRWLKFEKFIQSVDVTTPISLVWFKEASEETKMMKYVFDKTSDDMLELRFSAEAAGEVDVYLEHDCKWEVDGGYEPDEDEIRAEEGSEYGNDNSDEDDKPPKEDDEPEESEDETPAGDGENEKGKFGDDLDEIQEQETVNQNGSEGLNANQIEVDDGDEVVIDAGDGRDDDRFQSVFEEGSRINAELDNATRKLAEEQATERREEEVETDPEFGLEDSKYPDTPLESEEEWEEWKNPRREKRKDKFHGDLNKEPYIWLFQTFNSGLEFKDQLLRYSLHTQYDVKMAKSEANRIAAVCCKDKCPWKIFCSVELPINKWMVKLCHYKHNHGKSSRVSMLKQGVIAGLFREEIRRNVNLSAANIKDIIKERYDIVVNISKCYKGRRIALDSVLEAQAIQFAKLWNYEAELKRSHKDIKTEIVTVENNGRQQFQAFYICFDELRRTWLKCCRPVIGLDGCFLKWDLEGDLLAAVGRDADNKMYPIAWAVVTGENKDTWGWFINKLKTDLNLGVGENLTIISDKQKSLVIAMGSELPQAEHRMCARHIYGNWKKTFSRSEYKNLFWGVAYSYHQGEYEEKMKLVYVYDPVAYEALLNYEPEKWCRAFFNPESHCADVHNNLSEAFNRTIR